VNNDTATLRGLTIGDGTPYVWTSEPADLYSTPRIRVSDRENPRRHGVTAGDDLYGEKVLVFELAILGDTRVDAEQLVADLAAAWQASPTDEWLDVRITGTPAEYSLIGRPRRASIVLGSTFPEAVAEARLTFAATDPIRYGPASSIIIALAEAGAGFVLPNTLPAILSGGSGVGIGDAANDGSIAVEWSATFTGPLGNPRIEHVDSGQFVRVSAALAAGETLVVDSATATLLLNGSTPRQNWLAPGSRWFELAPGSNPIRFLADSGTGTVAIAWRSGWA
jgi:hypothetical protein